MLHEPVKLKHSLLILSREMALSHPKPHIPAWPSLSGLLKLPVVANDSKFTAFMRGSITDPEHGQIFSHFIDSVFDDMDFNHLTTSLRNFSKVAECFQSDLWSHCFKAVLDLLENPTRAGFNLHLIPCSYVCYTLNRLLREFYARSTRPYYPTPLELEEGFPAHLRLVPDCVTLFTTLMARLRDACTTEKIFYWREHIQGRPLDSQGKERTPRKEKTPTKKPKTPKVVTPPAKPTPTDKRKKDSPESSDSEDVASNKAPPKKKTVKGGVLYCAPYLLGELKIGDKSCTRADCPYDHSCPPSRNQVDKFVTQLEKYKSIPQAGKDELIKALRSRL